MNERLRSVMLREGVAESELAELCGVDPKTAQRWVVTGRVPHARHRWTVARRLNSDEAFLWPGAVNGEERRTELVELHADRATVPRETWLRLLTHAQAHIDLLVMSGTFYAQMQPRIATMLGERLENGVTVRLCFSDPTCDAVAVRDREERLGGVMPAKIRASLGYYRPTCRRSSGYGPRLCRGFRLMWRSAVGRVEYWHDADAPAANSLVPACGVLAVNEAGEILLQRRRDTGQWALPMGKMELGETPTQCAVRETHEETGVLVEVIGLVGIYSDPAHIVAYTDGEVRQEYEVTLLARPVAGAPAANDEASDVRWVASAGLDALDIHPTMRRQIDDHLTGRAPHVD